MIGPCRPRLSRIRDLGGAFERSRRDQPSSDVAVMPHTPSSSEGRPSACHAAGFRLTASCWVRLPQFRAALMSGDVWLGPGKSGGTPVGRRRGACGSGPFPAAPGPNRTGAFQRIRLSSGCHVQFAAGFRLPRARRIPVTVSAFCITHTSRLRNPSTAWPPSPCGRLSRPPWRGVTPATTTGPLSPWDSRPVGDPAFVPVIRASAT